MPENLSERLLSTVVKAASSKTKSGYENLGVSIDWNLNEGILRGNFCIPIQKMADLLKPGVTIIAEDFLTYLEP